MSTLTRTDRYERGADPPFGDLYLSPTGLIVDVNATLLSWLGYQRDELVGRLTAADLLTLGSREAYDATFAQSMAAGNAAPAFYRDFQRRDGSVLHGLVTRQYLTDGDKQLVGVRAVILDAVQCHADAVAERERTALLERRMEARTEQLEEQERRMRLALRDARVGVFDWDVPGEHLTWSPEADKIFGFDDGEFSGLPKDFQARIHPDEVQRTRDAIAASFACGGEHVDEHRVVLPDGAIRWVFVRGHVHRLDGRPVRMRGVIQDVTERRQLEAEVTQRGLQLELAAGLAGFGVWRSVRGTDEIETLVARGPLTGLPVDQRPASPADFATLVHPEDRDDVMTRVAQGFLVGTYHAQFRAVLPDGRERWVQSAGHATRDETGQIEHITGVDYDITAQRSLEAELRAANLVLEQRVAERTRELERSNAELQGSRDRFRLLANMSPTLAWSCDATQKRDWHSQRWLEWTGREEASELGNGWMIGVHPDDIDAYLQTRKRAYARRARYAHAYRHRNLDGEYGWLLDEGLPLLSPDGELLGYLGAATDITKQREHADEALRSQRQMLEIARFESLGVLSGGIAHDFNNILTGISANASYAHTKLAETDLAPVLADIEVAGQRAAALVQQLLAYAGQAQFVREPVRIADIASDARALVANALPAHASLHLDLGAGDVSVVGDRSQLQQIVTNLVLNAAEALPNGRGRVTVRTLAASDVDPWPDEHTFVPTGITLPCDGALAGTHVVLEVEDNGEGMSAETLSRCFDPFFSTKFVGRGLGLAAVLGIVRAHGGALRVRSIADVGTAVRVALPILRTPLRPASTAERFTPCERGCTVLLVDDDPIPRRAVARVLTRAGFRVVEAGSGMEGVELAAERGDIELAFIDLTRPGAGGVEAFDALRACRPDLRLMVMSGYTREQIDERFEGRAIGGFLPKPPDPQAVLDLACRPCDRRCLVTR